MTTSHASVRHARQTEAEKRVTRAGYKVPERTKSDVSDDKQDAAMVASGVHQHERNMHPGKRPTRLKLARGGPVEGDAPRHNLGKKPRGHKGDVNITVMNSDPAAKKDAAMQGMRVGAALGARKAAMAMQHPMGPPPGAAPPGAMGMPPHPMPPPGMMPTAAPGGPPRPMPGAGPMATGGKVAVREHHRSRPQRSH